jgi:hypothetical protein
VAGCIIATSANALTRAIRDRLPVVIEPQDLERWLSGARLRPTSDDHRCLWPVSRPVNRPGNGECLSPAPNRTKHLADFRETWFFIHGNTGVANIAGLPASAGRAREFCET